MKQLLQEQQQLSQQQPEGRSQAQSQAADGLDSEQQELHQRLNIPLSRNNANTTKYSKPKAVPKAVATFDFTAQADDHLTVYSKQISHEHLDSHTPVLQIQFNV
jgi:hypothetical protein